MCWNEAFLRKLDWCAWQKVSSEVRRGRTVIERAQTAYTKAPILESLIHIGIHPPEGISSSVIAHMHQHIDEKYPGCEEIQRTELKFGPGLPESSQAQVVGYKYSSSDGKQILQAQTDSFTFSRLAPYVGWEKLRDESQRLWVFYQELVAPVAVTQLAVRYINRLDLPLPIRDIRDYLRTYPEISSDMPINLGSYLMQIQMPYPEQQATVILNQSLLEPNVPDCISIQLDIAVASGQVFENEDYWAELEKLRTVKNEMFEACITNRTRELLR